MHLKIAYQASLLLVECQVGLDQTVQFSKHGRVNVREAPLKGFVRLPLGQFPRSPAALILLVLANYQAL
jgi:hypothetical protein